MEASPQSDYKPPDYLIACAHCHVQHARKEERYECSGCKAVVCWLMGRDGKKWNRKGELVHLKRVAPHQENPPYWTVCGTLRRVEDWKPEEVASE